MLDSIVNYTHWPMLLKKRGYRAKKHFSPYRRSEHLCGGKRNIREKPSGLFPKSKHPNEVRILLKEEKAKAAGLRFIAGVDEAGRGPLAGPVVAASVILKESDFTVRIDDSKKLSAPVREKAYQQILKKAIVGIGIIAEDIIDRINIHQATLLAMEEAVLNLGLVPDLLLIDGNIRLKLPYPQLGIIKGDQKYLSIACASIVAKVTRDRLLEFYDGLFPGYGFSRHKGYGTKGHIAILKDKGFCPIHRRSFRIKQTIH